MKRLISLFISAILFASLTYAQLFPPRGDKVNDLKEMLGLNKSQFVKVEKITKESKEKANKLRKKEMAVMNKLRDSTKTIYNESQKDILKVLTKKQSEMFKEMTIHKNTPEMPPPLLGMDEGNYPPNFVNNFPPPPAM